MTGEQRSALFQPRRLAIGTVQFGMHYGLAQQRVTENEVGRILRRADQAGVGLIDTAALYGQAEEVVGRQLPRPTALKLVTKTVKCGAADSAAATEMIRRGLHQSLERLQNKFVEAILIHDPADLLGPNGAAIWHALEAERAAGWIGQIGVSIYRGDEIDRLMERFPLDIVQLPFNALDRRLVEGGQLKRLHEKGVEIHARSIFLQGLLLMAKPQVDEIFPGLGGHLASFREFLGGVGLSPLEGALYAALARPEISTVVLGFLDVAELDAALAAVDRLAGLDGDLSIEPFAISDETILNPSLWKRK